MKKNLTKLALSGAALAAVAATLGTSTYAWYTANETVSATGIQGASAGATDASIFISKDTLAWSSTVALEAADITGGSLLPVEFISDTSTHTISFKDLGTKENSTYTPGSGRTVDAGAAKKFTLYFRSSVIDEDHAAPTVYLKNVDITTSNVYTAADNLFYTKTNGYGVATDQATYGVDISHALKMVAKTNAATAGLADGNVNDKSLDLAAFQNTTNDSNINVTPATAQSAGNNALSYYNAVMGTTLAASDNARQNQSVIDAKNTSTSQRTPISFGQVNKAAEYITVDFYIYLDGWDDYCYDACKGQSFTIDLEFTTDASEALTYAA